MADPLPPAPFEFSDEQRDLRRGVRQFCAELSDEPTVRRLTESALGHDPVTWARLGGELGVLGLAVPEDAGGAGAGLVDQAIVAEEFGSALLPGPVLGTVGLAVPALVALGDRESAADLLRPLVSGERTAALAVPERGGRFDPTAIGVGAARSGEAWELTGRVGQVVDGTAADLLLVAASGPDGVALFAVEGDARGTAREPLSTLDLTRRQAALRLNDAPARLVAVPEETGGVVGEALRVGAMLLAAEQLGGAQHLLDRTVAYAGARLQFGRPIGSFQAVKHRCADMLVAVEHARSTAYHAAWALQDRNGDDPDLAVNIAQATCTEAYYRVAADAVQLHGGIGFTWEHPLHLYYKRAVTDAALLGSAAAHRDHIARAVLDHAVPTGGLAVADGR